LLAACGANIGPRVDFASFFALEMQAGGLITPSLPGQWQALTTLHNPRESCQDVLAVHPRQPLARYLAMISNPRLPPFSLGGGGTPWQGFLKRLLDFHVRYLRRGNPVFQAEIEAEIRKVREGSRDVLSWAVLSRLHQLAAGNPASQRSLSAAYRFFEKVPGLTYEARYEHARSLLLRGRHPEARTRFLDLYTQTLKEGLLPRIDRSFREALQGDAGEVNFWAKFVRQTATTLVTNGHRRAAVLLTWQCWQLGDHALAGDLLTTALGHMPDGPERLRTTLLAIDYLWETRQLRQAEKVLDSLLGDKHFAGRSGLWRLGAALARQRKQTVRSFECLERAVDIDFRHLGEVIDLGAVRRDFGLLLDHYLQVTGAAATLKKSPPRNLAAKVVRAADRWRALDPDNPVICPLAAQILYKLGVKELAWEYLNTPVAVFAPEAGSWLEFAQALSGQEDFAMADLAYEQACQAEPDNARLLWERAKNLERAGKKKQARKVYGLLAAGKWEDRFQWIKDEARRQLKGR
jgi:tetratricopeptide (TPR) repeat protein